MSTPTPFVAWDGCTHTHTGLGVDGRTYLLETNGGDTLMWIDNEPMLDVYTSMDAAKEAAADIAFMNGGHLTPLGAITPRVEGMTL